MKKSLSDGFTRQIVVVSFDDYGKRIERDFDTIAEDEKMKIRILNNQRALKAVGYVRVDKKAAK